MSRRKRQASRRIRLPWLDRLTIRLAGGMALIVVATLTLGLYMITSHHYQSLLDASRREALRRGELVRVALEYQMTEQPHLNTPADQNLTRRLVESFATQPELERVMVLNRDGEVKISSDPSMIDVRISRASPTCIVCHALPPSERLRSGLLDQRDGTMLRAVEPIYNRPRCHQCHDAAQRINGIVIVDVSTTAIRAEIARDRRRMLAVTGGLCVVLLGGIGLLMRHMVLRRLHRLGVASRALAAGALDERVPVEGDDALTSVAVEFNAMAESMSQLVDEVSSHQKRLENVMDSVDDGMVVLDRSLRVTAFNDAFARRFAVDRHYLSGRHCYGIAGAPADCKADACDACPAVRCFATATLQRAVRTRRAVDGSERIEEIYVSPVHGDGGEVKQVVEVWRDITDRKSTEAKMAEFDRLASLGMLASGFSHEVNTPLGSMLVCIEAILPQIGGPCSDDVRAEIIEYATVIRTEILRCKGITRQFLQLSRGEHIAAALVDVNSVARAVLPIVNPTARAAGVSIAFEPCLHAPPVMASGGAVQQVFLNLLINAIQASPRGSVVKVHLRCDEGLCLLVEDQGAGVAARDQKRIFEPFFSTRPSGTGLGLFVSLSLARNWGGDVSIESEEGCGAIFAVRFPAVRDQDERREPAAG